MYWLGATVGVRKLESVRVGRGVKLGIWEVDWERVDVEEREGEMER